MTLTFPAHRAWLLAQYFHSGQVDKAGHPYTGHLFRVAERLAGWGQSSVVVATGYLHDVTEDTPATTTLLYQLGVPAVITESVHVLDRNNSPSAETYYERVNGYDDTRIIKLADICDNASQSRLHRLDPQTKARLLVKYSKALDTFDPDFLKEYGISVGKDGVHVLTPHIRR